MPVEVDSGGRQPEDGATPLVTPGRPDSIAHRIAEAAIRCGGLVLVTDFDGSLAPLVDDPASARPLPEAVAALEWLSRRGAARGVDARCPTRVLVVSARDSDDVAGRLSLGPEAEIVGNGGLERWQRGRIRVVAGVERWLGPLEEAAEELAEALGRDGPPGVRLERKRCAVVVHSRTATAPGADAAAAALATRVARRYGLAVSPGKRAVELRPPFRRDKGTAVRASLRGRWATRFLCAAGDDVGDVPLLRLAAARGGLGVAILDDETPLAVVEAAGLGVPGPPGWAATLAELVIRLRRPDAADRR